MKKSILLLFCAMLLNGILFANADKSLANYSKYSKQKDDKIVANYKEITPWGMSVSIDLHAANPKMIRDGKVITKFMKDLDFSYTNLRFTMFFEKTAFQKFVPFKSS